MGRVYLCSNGGIQIARNLKTYEGSDILAALLAGRCEYAPNYCYFEFTNQEDPPQITPDRRGREYYASISPGDDIDYLRVPVSTAPALEASSNDFLHNRTVFTCAASGTCGINGLPFGEDSRVYGLAIVTGREAQDPSRDLVFARTYDFTPIVVSGTVFIVWTYEFD